MSTTTTAVEGASPDDDSGTDVDPENRVFEHMSLRGPALIVLGIAVFIVITGVVASALDSGSSPTLSLKSVTIPDGTVVHLGPASVAMKKIVSAGEPPADILGNLAVPTDSTFTRFVNADQGQTQFDRTVYFHTGLSSEQLVDTYRSVFSKLGWKVIYAGSGAERASSNTEVLAKKGSGDGFYWEAGVVISPTTSAGTTPYSIELFELPDDN
jgi:hypothetical protein